MPSLPPPPINKLEPLTLPQDELTPALTRGELRNRGQIVLSFWFVVLGLGLPLWYLTTSIYRAPLPLSQMKSWSEGNECKIEFPLLVDVLVDKKKVGAVGEVKDLIREVQLHLDDAREGKMGGGHLRLRFVEETSCPLKGETLHIGAEERGGNQEEDEHANVAAVLRLLPGEPGSTEHTHSLQSSQRTIDLFYSSAYNPASSASLASLSSYAAKMLHEIFREEDQMINHFLGKASLSNGDGDGNGSREGIQQHLGIADMSRKTARMIHYSSTYHITFSLFTGSGVPSSWDIVPAVETYFTPLLNALSPISNFTVESQVQFYASFSPTIRPLWNEELKAWTLTKDDLSNFINSAEWPLTSIKSDPTINFIIYIPESSSSPLVIPESAGNAWLLPQWGGVAILNPSTGMTVDSNTAPTHLSLDDLKPSLDIFATQLLALLGTPASPSTSSSLPIRIDSLTRQRTAETLLSASATLGSLARLVLALPSIAIPPTVSLSVSNTITALEKGCTELRQGRFSRALKQGRIASEEAEKAFFERTMVAQVYFPDEHKVAVYLPLLGPVGVPLVMGGIKVLKAIMGQRRHALEVGREKKRT